VASGYPVTVVRTEGNVHRKSGALNWAWRRYARDADVVIGVDADTVLPPHAVADWCAELEDDPRLGGSSSRFTMPMDRASGLWPRLLTRMQRAEFARWSQASVDRGHTSVLAGTGCAIRGEALRRVAERADREGPWSYASAVEDFELTYRIRELGYHCRVSPTVPAFTDSMTTVRALWAQRMKWQTGTVRDLMSIGFNRLTARDWGQQALGLFSAFSRSLWLTLWIAGAATGMLRLSWTWWAFPAFFAAMEAVSARRIPDRDWRDVILAMILIPNEIFSWLRAGWFTWSWATVMAGNNDGDLWSRQYSAEKAGR
jgi:cellulose synthase/poly-beta-1,6-N-acetylglucosamine synthase-like glycosyltransferase